MRFLLLSIVTLTLTACGSNREREAEVRYIPVPEGYLQECELPPAPVSTGELSEAFVRAYQCGEQGNRDKQRIRELVNEQVVRDES